jgi:hydroxymethylpyrimidine pyrophosphatase-like HAD family hydrolase
MNSFYFGSKAPRSVPGVSPGYLQSIENRIAAERGGRDIMVLSDYDNTLVLGSAITGEVADAAKGLHLVVATARLATNRRLSSFWEKGLVRPNVPIIVENGGSLAFQDKNGLRFVDVVDPDVPAKLAAAYETLESNRKQLGLDFGTEIKLGRTMVDLIGMRCPDGLAELAGRIENLVADPSIRAVDTGSTITIQDRSVHKPGGFMAYLDIAGIDRGNIYEVGMGDAPNDAEVLAHADLSLAFHERVALLADIHVTDGAAAAPAVLRAISGIRDPNS